MDDMDKTHGSTDFGAIRDLPNNRETILGAVDELARKAKNAGVTETDFTNRISPAYGANREHVGPASDR